MVLKSNNLNNFEGPCAVAAIVIVVFSTYCSSKIIILMETGNPD
jgi:hypothetical protein